MQIDDAQARLDRDRAAAAVQMARSALAADSRIKSVLPVVEGSGLIRRGQVNRAILLRGFDLAQADRIYDISNSISAGNQNAPDGAVLLGKDLAADLGVNAGDPIQLVLSGREALTVMVDGIFDLGVSAINQRWLVMDQRKASALLGLGDRGHPYRLCVGPGDEPGFCRPGQTGFHAVAEAADRDDHYFYHHPGGHFISLSAGTTGFQNQSHRGDPRG